MNELENFVVFVDAKMKELMYTETNYKTTVYQWFNKILCSAHNYELNNENLTII